MLYKNPTQEELTKIFTTIDNNKYDVLTPLSSMLFTHDRKLFFCDESNNHYTLELTYHAFKQLFTKIANKFTTSVSDEETFEFGGKIRRSSATDFLWTRYDVYVAEFLNQLLRDFLSFNDDKYYMLRCKENHIRACLVKTYKPISNSRIVQTVLDNCTFERIASVFIDDNFINAKLIAKDWNAEDSDYGSGYEIVNDEIGLRSVQISGIVKRTICDNSIRVIKPMRFYHTGELYQRLEERLPELPIQLTYADQLYEKFQEAASIKFSNEDFKFLIDSARKEHDWTDEFHYLFLKGTEKQQTLQGVVNGLTFAAHECYPKNLVRQMYFETVASEMLVQG